MSLTSPGVRVIRGPDWSGGDVDGGEGGVGTIVEASKAGTASIESGTTVVRWDSGQLSQCPTGQSNTFSLRAIDNAVVGVRHPEKSCKYCTGQENGVSGILWMCTTCNDLSLCTHHYMNDKHDLNHPFLRLDAPATAQQAPTAIMVPPRKGSRKIPIRGVFPGAKVQRSADWMWQDQDGGVGKVGKVLEIQDWDIFSVRSVANISWTTTGITNVYRIGHKGKVDVQCLQPGSGGHYYIDHLPIVGKKQSLGVGLPRSALPEVAKSAIIPTLPTYQMPSNFRLGELVRVVVNSPEELEELQENHGGFNPQMLEVVGLIGQVHRLTSNGDVRVQYNGQPASAYRWTINPQALTSAQTKVNDHVKLISSADFMQKLQTGHGGWSDDMIPMLGKVGRIIKVYPDNDVRVHVLDREWTLNPACLKIVTEPLSDNNEFVAVEDDAVPLKVQVPTASNSKRDEELLIHACINGDLQSVQQIFATEKVFSGKSIQACLQEICTNGHLTILKELLDHLGRNDYPPEVFCQPDGKTILQISAQRGHLGIVKLLLSDDQRSNLINARDPDGDSALHYAAYGKKKDVIEYLLSRGADVNVVNEKCCSVLHISVLVSDVEVVRLLLEQPRIGVNIRDAFEDTPLHEAIVKDCQPILELLCRFPHTDFTLANRRGFNSLQYAALKGSYEAIKIITEITQRSLVNVCKDDGFTPLHLASLNGHVKVVSFLLGLPEVVMTSADSRGRNCLHCAIHQGHSRVIELVIEEGRQRSLLDTLINQVDLDGDTPLHVALRREGEPNVDLKNDSQKSSDSFDILMSNVSSSGLVAKPFVHPMAIASLLIQNGANCNIRNKAGYQPKDYILDSNLRLFLSQCEQKKPLNEKEMQSKAETHCQICCEPMRGSLRPVLFEPCGHIIVCTECCPPRMKKCLQCKGKIDRKIPVSIENDITNDEGTEDEEVKSLRTLKLQSLEEKVQNFEQHYQCAICMERKKTIAFLCGHGTCGECVETLKCCHMCRGPIDQKINLY